MNHDIENAKNKQEEEPRLPADYEMENREGDIYNLLGRILWNSGEWDCQLERVLSKLPTDVLSELENRITVIFAPGQYFDGRPSRMPPVREGFWLYLSSQLFGKNTDYIEGTIAHELAHIFLGHEELPLPAGQGPAEGQKGEIEADRLATAWGFKPPRSLWNPPEASP